MGRLGFHLSRVMRDEDALQRFSAPLPDLTGQAVAVVGNARALADRTYGPDIDAHDVVIRINRAPMPSPQSHGTRTDWLALAVRISDADMARIEPGRVLWMSHKRKRLSHDIATSPGFHLHPLADWQQLGNTLGAPPSTGAMVIDILARSKAMKVDLYGFDFFASKSLSGRRDAAQVPHDFEAEAAWVRDLLAKDDRFTLMPL